ncbi:MAG: cytochrome oxidase putative small subunit CydP [Candidatus Berkiellales bacterium]
MKDNSFRKKIVTVLLIKISLLICIWKLFFSAPLSEQERVKGLSSYILSFANTFDLNQSDDLSDGEIK